MFVVMPVPKTVAAILSNNKQDTHKLSLPYRMQARTNQEVLFAERYMSPHSFSWNATSSVKISIICCSLPSSQVSQDADKEQSSLDDHATQHAVENEVAQLSLLLFLRYLLLLLLLLLLLPGETEAHAKGVALITSLYFTCGHGVSSRDARSGHTLRALEEMLVLRSSFVNRKSQKHSVILILSDQ